MASSMLVKLVCMVVVCMVVGAPIAQAITCGQVTSTLSPCINYVQSGGDIPPGCCSGIRTLNSAAKTTADRQATCNCLKQLAAAFPGADLSRAAGLPGKCGVNIPYKIDPSTDCASVK